MLFLLYFITQNLFLPLGAVEGISGVEVTVTFPSGSGMGDVGSAELSESNKKQEIRKHDSIP